MKFAVKFVRTQTAVIVIEEDTIGKALATAHEMDTSQIVFDCVDTDIKSVRRMDA